jgi:hypothetical protein
MSGSFGRILSNDWRIIFLIWRLLNGRRAASRSLRYWCSAEFQIWTQLKVYERNLTCFHLLSGVKAYVEFENLDFPSACPIFILWLLLLFLLSCYIVSLMFKFGFLLTFISWFWVGSFTSTLSIDFSIHCCHRFRYLLIPACDTYSLRVLSQISRLFPALLRAITCFVSTKEFKSSWPLVHCCYSSFTRDFSVQITHKGLPNQVLVHLRLLVRYFWGYSDLLFNLYQLSEAVQISTIISSFC